MGTLKLPFILRLTLVLLSILVLGYILKIGKPVIAPFFFAFMVSLLFLPFANFLERKLHFARILSTLSSVLLMLALLMGLGYFFGTQLSDFGKDIPQLQSQFTGVFNDIQEWVSHTFHINTEEQFDYINKGLDKLLSSTGAIVGFTFGIFTTSLGFLFFFVLFFIFILNYRSILYHFILEVFAERHQSRVINVIGAIQHMSKSYILGLLIQLLIVSLLTWIVLSIIGVKYAILLAVLTGVLNVIPYIGISISAVLAAFIAFATGEPAMSLYVLLGYWGVHLVDGNIILPFVVGSKVKINALFSFLGILVGEQLWGIIGMFLCIPALAMLKIIFEGVDDLKPWGALLGEGRKKQKPKRQIRISKNITLKEKD